jgi:hypothetical protein
MSTRRDAREQNPGSESGTFRIRVEREFVMAATPARWYRHLAAVLAAVCAAAAAVNAAAFNAAAFNAMAGTALARTPDGPYDTARLTSGQRAVLLDATRRFRDVKRAVAAGYRPTKDCAPGMGFHYANPALAGDTNIDPTLPEILVYTPAAGGSVRLAALEYFRADADGSIKTAEDRPTLFGHPFNGPMAGHPLPPGQPPMPVHYDLHVWLYESNPNGELTSENPKVNCQ